MKEEIFMSLIMPERTTRFMPSNELFMNPHKGFTTFANGSRDCVPEIYPETTLHYVRIYWRFFEPQEGQYQFDLFDKEFQYAEERGQKVLIRLMPYGEYNRLALPEWVENQLKDKPLDYFNYRSFHFEDDVYIDRFSDAILALGSRYNGDPRLDMVDMAIYGAWGEGMGSRRLSNQTVDRIIKAYVDAFPDTPISGLIEEPRIILRANRYRPVGWRADCLGDMRGTNADPASFRSSHALNKLSGLPRIDDPEDSPTCHMLDWYPRYSRELLDLWKKAPVSFESCWTMDCWKDNGWDLDYIIEESLKWHVTNFNPKSHSIPKEWMSASNEWIRKMGYDYQLRYIETPTKARPGDSLFIGMWMENMGVAPVYHPYWLGIRLKNDHGETLMLTNADARNWLPGDNYWDGTVRLPVDIAPGHYSMQAALIDPHTMKPGIQMPIRCLKDEGYTVIGNFTVEQEGY